MCEAAHLMRANQHPPQLEFAPRFPGMQADPADDRAGGSVPQDALAVTTCLPHR